MTARSRALALALAVLAAACDSGPSGPGTLDAVIPANGLSVGAAVVTVTGPSVRGISAAGATRVYSSPVGQANTYRVVLVNEAPGDLLFGVEVDDVGADFPTASILEVVDGTNQAFPAIGGFTVRFER